MAPQGEQDLPPHCMHTEMCMHLFGGWVGVNGMLVFFKHRSEIIGKNTSGSLPWVPDTELLNPLEFSGDGKSFVLIR